MKQKQYTYNKGIAGLLMATFCLLSCEQEEALNQSNVNDVESGMFVVDYLPSEGFNTRTISDNQPKGVRINSLTYLLYNESGVLEKRREIPGLEGDNEVWPLKRENMTWEQREALKDTLMQGVTYHALFVANADPAICGWKDEQGVPWWPLNGVDDYSTVCLHLPLQAFSDRTMFYLSSQEILSTKQQADYSHSYSCPVVLKRVVTRTDFLFERLPDWPALKPVVPAPTPLSVKVSYPLNSSDLPKEVEGYLKQAVTVLLDGQMSMVLEQLVQKSVGVLAQLKEQFNKKIVPAPTLPLQPPLTPDQEAANKRWQSYIKAIEELSAQIEDPAGREMYKERLYQEPVAGGLASALQSHFYYLFLQAVSANEQLRTVWKHSWKDEISGLHAQVMCGGQALLADRYYMDKSTRHEGVENYSAALPVDIELNSFGKRYRGFNWVSFANPQMNGVTQINWLVQGTAASLPAMHLTAPIQTGQLQNECYRVVYYPVASLKQKDGGMVNAATTVVCNLDQSLPFSAVTQPTAGFVEELKGAMNEVLTELGYQSPAPLTALSWEVSYPNYADASMLQVEELWDAPQMVIK